MTVLELILIVLGILVAPAASAYWLSRRPPRVVIDRVEVAAKDPDRWIAERVRARGTAPVMVPAVQWNREWNRPPIERYVRCSHEVGVVTFEPGVEYRDGDDFSAVLARMREITALVAEAEFHQGALMVTAMDRSRAVCDVFAAEWPDRAWFCDVFDSGPRGWAQTFQPFGVPRNRDAAQADQVLELAARIAALEAKAG